MNTFDVYQTANNLASLLASSGHGEDADLLRHAIEDGSTGTEILMAIRFDLRKMLEKASLKDKEEAIYDLISEIDKILE